ncbi:MAG: FAD-dependent oxidoreductase, partial [Eubacteriales bacterium]|nr:FAD-dependent oxidoreductase [Eubacteriales bacterium]
MRLMTLRHNQSAALDASPAFGAECDLLVAGLGTAGTELAILAARQGLSVIAVEKGGAPCGQGGIGGVWDYYFGTPGGAWEERDRTEDARMAGGYAHRGVARTLVSDEALAGSGVDARYETAVLGVWMSGKRAEGLRVACHGRAYDIRARITADCTGSALLVRMAGGGYTAGRAWDGAQMAFSKVITHTEPNAPVQSRYSFCGRMNGFPDEETFTQMALTAATLPPCLWEARGGRVFMESPMLAQREEGNIVAEEGVTFEDALRGKRTDKPVFYSFTTQDLSNVDRDYAFEDDALQNWMAICTLDRYGYSVAVPFGAMIPKGYDALLAVGKHFGVDHDLAGGLRMKRDLKKLAEAAAYACALAVKHNISVRDVDYDALAGMLRATGCLDARVDQGIGDLRIDPDMP